MKSHLLLMTEQVRLIDRRQDYLPMYLTHNTIHTLHNMGIPYEGSIL